MFGFVIDTHISLGTCVCEFEDHLLIDESFCLLPQLLIWYIVTNKQKEVLAKTPASTALALPPVLVLQAKNVGHGLIRFHIIEHDYLDLKF